MPRLGGAPPSSLEDVENATLGASKNAVSRLQAAPHAARMAPKKGKKKKDDDWEDEMDAIALEASLEIMPDSKAAPAEEEDDGGGGKANTKKVSQ